MAVLKFDETPYEKVKEGLQRKIIHTDKLMTVVIDFTNGPWSEPEPPHNHPHEQTAYVAEGELIFLCEGEPDQHLKAGDMYAVPPNKMHTIQLLSATARIVDNFTPLREDFMKK
ncbi:cupin domain-containing protein [Saccharicrinis sp. FJH54]|uniref:cupin domain-containing protein n=1 Tax=Saccharicrinis sp. FJH54 TaxID=3344665 RepID=UPI0035D51367